jgi:hypothetical protein
VFQDYEDDQYDFHTYCMRRMTISAYLAYVLFAFGIGLWTLADTNRLMTYEDQLRSHPAYFKSALGAIEIYTAIHDNPSLTKEEISKLALCPPSFGPKLTE